MSPIVAELERVYREGVQRWFQGDRALLDDQPIITVASRGRKATVNSWYNPAVWTDRTEDLLSALAGDEETYTLEKRAEIVVASEILNDPVQAVAEVVKQTLAHRNPHLRVKEGFYHPYAWESVAPGVECDAQVNPAQPGKGWSMWVPRPAFRQWAESIVNADLFDVFRDSAKPLPKGSRMKKWSCGCTNIRSAVYVNALCKKCSKPFLWAEPLEAVPRQWGPTLREAVRIMLETGEVPDLKHIP